VDSSTAITAGREVFGQAQKYGRPALRVDKDTLLGTVHYGTQQIATATCSYDFELQDLSDAYAQSSIPELNLKVIPGADGRPDIAQLVQVTQNPNIDRSTVGPARLSVLSHVNAPVADFPVLQALKGVHTRYNSLSLRASVLLDFLK
jgi:acetoacetate decarboxylase